MRVDYSITLLVALLSSAGFWTVVQWFASRKHRQAERSAEEQVLWFAESKNAYTRVKKECDDCQKKVAAVQRELNDVKTALFDRLNAFDEILPHVSGLSDDKVRELRRANHAVKAALYRSYQ